MLSYFKSVSEFEAKVLSQCPQGVGEKANYILRYIAENSSHPGDRVVIEEDLAYALFLLQKRNPSCDSIFIASKIANSSSTSPPVGVKVCVCQQADGSAPNSLRNLTPSPSKPLWRCGLTSKWTLPSRRASCHWKKDTEFRMYRTDREEFNDKICDRIIAEIRRSRFMIADVTGHRHAVYFEAGYAKGLGLDVIWTCREDEMEETGSQVRHTPVQLHHVEHAGRTPRAAEGSDSCYDWRG